MPAIGAIVLAAGSSSRLGRPKQLLPYEGESLIRRTIRAALGASCSPVVVVVGYGRERIEEELAGLEVLIGEHPHWHQGIGSSLRAGLRQMLEHSPDIDAVLTLVSDQPFVTSSLLSKLINARKETGLPVAACEYAETLGVPALFDSTVFHVLAGLGDQQGARTILKTLSKFVAHVPFPEGAIDIDTPADAARWIGEKLEVPALA